jgi:hypothetical protein
VAAEIVHDDNAAGLERRDQELLDIRKEVGPLVGLSRTQAFEGLETLSEVVDADELGEMASKVLVRLV